MLPIVFRNLYLTFFFPYLFSTENSLCHHHMGVVSFCLSTVQKMLTGHRHARHCFRYRKYWKNNHSLTAAHRPNKIHILLTLPLIKASFSRGHFCNPCYLLTSSAEIKVLSQRDGFPYIWLWCFHCKSHYPLGSVRISAPLPKWVPSSLDISRFKQIRHNALPTPSEYPVFCSLHWAELKSEKPKAQ